MISEVAYYSSIVLGGIIVILELIKILCSSSDRQVRKQLDIGSCMTIGSREVQEDQFNYLTTEAGVMAVLADGAGKTFGGRIASRIAVQTCTEIFEDYNAFNNPQYFFRKAFHCANKEILKAVGDENRGTASAGCVLIRNKYLFYAVVGNVKVCVFRENALVPVSTGHTIAVLAEQRFQEGKIAREEALSLLANHRLYNCLGKDDFKDIEYFDAPIRLKKNDIVVLMSDGVYELLGYKELETILGKEQTCQQKAFEIIEMVNQDASKQKDNASILLISVGTEL